MPEHPLVNYLRGMNAIRAIGAGTAEESYYPCLEQLLGRVGEDLRPRVLPVGQLGGVKSDYGLFTEEQIQEGEPVPGQLPKRGAVEVKPVEENLDRLIESKQVNRYLKRYQKVLVTNYRSFAFIENVEIEGNRTLPAERERFELAKSSEEFWLLASNPKAVVNEVGGHFIEFMQRVLRYGAALTDPKDLAWFLASYARQARTLIDRASKGSLDELRNSLEIALDLRFTNERAEHFFRSTVVQTLFYGLFSAWVVWHREREEAKTQEDFTWHGAGLHLRVPVMQALFDRVAMPGRIQRLGLQPLLDRATRTLARVDRATFFDHFEDEHAIQYFYEPFLEAFDPDLRDELGVWYTPIPVVEYMVDRVDTMLRNELGLDAGLADKRVVVLDPACGTGAYLVAVLNRIAKTLRENGAGDTLGVELKEAAKSRIYGFEILTASFVVAHLQVGLFLRGTGAPLGADERASIYLTNALTGWETHEQQELPIPELADEIDAASHVKLEELVLVVLGNPPYYGYSGVKIGEERDLTEAYRTTDAVAAPTGPGLNDPYVRFFRMAERAIIERSPGHGVVCLITNSSWLDGMSHTGMRERFLEVFHELWIDNLHGDKRRTGKLTPEGEPDPSIFSTQYNREGIQVGTAITLLLRRPGTVEAPATVHYRDLWGKNKLDNLADSSLVYGNVVPELKLGLPMVPRTVADDYLTWPSLPDLLPFSSPGIKTSRDPVLVDIDRDRLEERMRRYFDPFVAKEQINIEAPELMAETKRFDPKATRKTLLKEGFRADRIVRYAYRPMDLRWLYWQPSTKLLDEKRPDYVARHFEGNIAILTTGRTRKELVEPPLVVRVLADLNILDSGARAFPFYREPDDSWNLLADGKHVSNLSDVAQKYLREMGVESKPELLFYHVIAALHSPAYRVSNSGGLRQGWPRIPLPRDSKVLMKSAALGQRVASLLDPEVEVEGVTRKPVESWLLSLGIPTSTVDRPLDPGKGDFSLTSGWGYRGPRGITMPGRGHSELRSWTPEEESRSKDGEEPLQTRTYDIYLNKNAYWGNVPERVWSYTLGGYPILKKWLSYREHDLLGRDLKLDEVVYFQAMVRRIAALLVLESALDESYENVLQALRR